MLCLQRQIWWTKKFLKKKPANSMLRKLKPFHMPYGNVNCCIRYGVRSLVGLTKPKFQEDLSLNLWHWFKVNLSSLTSFPQVHGRFGVGEIRHILMNQFCLFKKLQRKPNTILLPTGLGIAQLRRNNLEQGQDGPHLHSTSIKLILMVQCLKKQAKWE